MTFVGFLGVLKFDLCSYILCTLILIVKKLWILNPFAKLVKCVV